MDNVAFDVIVLILLVALIALVAGLFLRTRRIGRDSASTSPIATSGSRQEATTRGEVAPHASAAATSGTGAMPSTPTPTPSAVTSGEGRPADPDPSSLAGGRATGAASVTSSGSAEGVDRDTGPRGGEHGSAALVERAAQLRGEAERTAAEIRAEADEYHRAARRRADQVLREAQQNRHEADDEIRAQRGEVRELRLDLERREHRVAERETRLDGETQLLHAKLAELDQGRAELADQVEQAQQAEARRVQELERVAGLSSEQAKQELVASVEHDAKRQAILLARSIESSAQAQAESKARSILVSAIQRLASDQTAESVVAAVHLPSDEMKGRIIGREGRNIRSFEQVTGVNVLIDDTPETVLLSCFDPVRREAARLTLAELIEDGRIHPVRIEEVHERSQSKITERCLRAAEDALADVGISDLHTELVPILGTLRYRTSYGQNVLKHSVECAHLAGVMAAELGLDVAVCKRSAFLHDIGKALTHEVEGSHALIGADLARKYGEHPDVVHAIEAHHNEVEPQTVEAVLTQAADAISGSRPGARRESLEAYVERLDRLEEIALAHDGVEKVFAMQAGREVRVMVSPDVIDDIAAQVLARDIVKQVEEELTYPGQIRVTVVRESRAVETAR